MIARCTRGILAVAGLFTSASFLCAQTPLQIVTDSLPPASVGVAYNQQLVTSGGNCVANGSASSTIDVGALPTGLAVTSPASMEQWFLQGTPSASGNFSFTVHVRWTHTRITPFQPPDCVEDAVKTLTLTVQGNQPPAQTLSADKTQIATTYNTGQIPPGPDTVRVSASGGGTAGINVQSVTDSGGPWLSVTPQRATTPAVLTVTYSVTGMTVGTYTGRVTVTPDSGASLTIPVTLQVVTDTTTSTLAADRTQIATTYHTGQRPPDPDNVKVSAAGGGAAGINIQSVTDSGGPWLSVTPQRSTTPAVLTVNYSVTGMAVGTYTGRVTVTPDSGTPLTIPVTLQVVTDSNIVLQAAPASLAFTMIAGSPDPPTQSTRVTVNGDNKVFQATISSAPPNAKWLTLKTTLALTPATLDIAVTAKDLAPGVYNGVITLTVSGATNSSVAVPVSFTIQAPAQKPTISAGGVINAAGAGNAIAPGTWVSLFGTSLATTTRAWRDADFVNGRLPTGLDGVSVTINGKAAAVAFVSPLQINVLAADDVTTGLVPVQVKNALGTSDSVLVLQQTAAPAFFQFPGTKYAAGVHADGSYLPTGTAGTAAKVGETIVLFGTGFGATDPASPATSQVPVPLPLARPQDLRVRIGGLDATIAYAGLISPGVYQFNVVVPQVGAGDQPVVAELRGLLTQSALLLTIQQ